MPSANTTDGTNDCAAIEAGHTSDALTDLTGNPSFTVSLDEMQTEIVDGSLWKSILEWSSNGFMMGCGSHSGSDTNHNDLGIVLGHAFSVLDVKDVDNIKFMQIRNPHGNGGQEWTGDYSDNRYVICSPSQRFALN